MLTKWKEWAAPDHQANGAHHTTDAQMIFKTLHDQKDLAKDSKDHFYWQQITMNTNSV